ncbi:MAG: hypothetical protein H0V09_08875, partial [Gemmatimonadetes bacterium]|nr:hypothetical protein [Gemmatimonadota bacterium]
MIPSRLRFLLCAAIRGGLASVAVAAAMGLAAAPAHAQKAQARVSASPASAASGASVTVTLKLDVSGIPAPNNSLGAYDGFFRWNPSVLRYVSKTDPGFGSPVTNVSDAGNGTIRFANFSSNAQTGNVTILTLVFQVVGTSGSSPLDIDVQSASSGSLSSLSVQNNDGTFAVTVSNPPAIGLNKTAVSFTARVGGSNPATQTFTISNTGGGTLSWTVSDNAAWLTASPA